MQIPKPGDTFEGKFEIRRRLGAGGFANVFLAVDHELGREVALKVLTPEAAGGYRDGVEARFMREARVLAGLQDQHTIRLFSYGRAPDGLLYMVFQYVPGEDLAEVLDRGPLPLSVTLHITNQLLMALDEAHTAGVLHRDLKPANIFVHEHLGDKFAVKLLDFGVAKLDPTKARESLAKSLTKTGVIVGTPRYMAPEQVFGEPFGPPADLHAVGLLMIEMLTGEPAVAGDSNAVMSWHLLEREHVVPRGLAGPAVTAVVQRLLALRPERRFQTARETRAALERAIAKDAGERRSEPRSDENANGRRWAIVGATAVVVVAVGALILISVDSPRTKQPVEVQLPREISAPRLTEPERVPVEPTSLVAADVGEADAQQDAGVAELGAGCVPRSSVTGTATLIVDSLPTFAVLPSNYDGTRAYPLVLAFHPAWISEFTYSTELNLPQLREQGKLDYIVAFVPSATKLKPWEQPGDIQRAEATLEAARAELCIDERQIFAVGHSHGADMARRFACHRPLSGLALTSYLPAADVTWCEDPPPTLWAHGARDEVMRYDGAAGCTPERFISGKTFISMLSKQHGCKPGQSRPGRCRDLQCTDEPLRLCLTDGGHHNVSERGRYLLQYPTCNRVNLGLPEDTIWDFFREHGRTLDE